MPSDPEQAHRFPNAHPAGNCAVVSKLKAAGPSAYSETKRTLQQLVQW